MKNDSYYMKIALGEAEKALEMGEIPIGAVLVDKNGMVVSCGHNMREAWNDATAHAEIIVIREAGKKIGEWRLSGCTLYVTVEPCPMCAGAAVMARVARIVYGVPNSRDGGVESVFNIPGGLKINHQVEIRAGVLEDECIEIMQRFFSHRR